MAKKVIKKTAKLVRSVKEQGSKSIKKKVTKKKLSNKPDQRHTNFSGVKPGLIRHSVTADDGHPLRIYSRHAVAGKKLYMGTPVLLLHGRTWSSQPVYDLRYTVNDESQHSLLETLQKLGFSTFAVDWRGFGETDNDKSGQTTPQRCVEDTHVAIQWISKLHNGQKPYLFGWSQAALVGMMYAQQYGDFIAGVTLYGSIYDRKTVYPRRPLYNPKEKMNPPKNTHLQALEDFAIPGSIDDEAAQAFGDLCMEADPYKVQWRELHEFNSCNPALVRVPTQMIAGSEDPYVSWDAQHEMFARLGTPDKRFDIIPDSDHCVHMLNNRHMLTRAFVAFMERSCQVLGKK